MRKQKADPVQLILAWLAQDSFPRNVVPDIKLPPGWGARVREATRRIPADFTAGAKREVATRLPNSVGARRQIALARLAGALAGLHGAEGVTDAHVREAARLTSPAGREGPVREERASSASTDTTPQENDAVATEDTAPAEAAVLGSPTLRPTVFRPDSETNLPGTAVSSHADPVEQAEAQHEWAPLRLPPRRYRRTIGGRGAVVGVRHTDSLRDLAIFQTLLEAGKYQPIRRKILLERDGKLTTDLVLSPTDLRGYLRVPVVEQMLMLMIDFTSLGHCDWQTPLSYYLGQAYVERMQVGIVRVGARETPGLLRADRLVARNLLDLRVYARINSHPGQSTPLAHGLDLAYTYLRSTLQHGRQAIDHATLVVISDGRGNVPLENSRNNQMPTTAAGTQGIVDALAVARDIRRLKGLDVVFLSPPTDYYPQLMEDLAQALGATPIPIKAPDEVEAL